MNQKASRGVNKSYVRQRGAEPPRDQSADKAAHSKVLIQATRAFSAQGAIIKTIFSKVEEI